MHITISSRRVAATALTGLLSAGLAVASGGAWSPASASPSTGPIFGEAASAVLNVPLAGLNHMAVNDVVGSSFGTSSGNSVALPANPVATLGALATQVVVASPGGFSVDSKATTAVASLNIPGLPIAAEAVTAHVSESDGGTRGNTTIAMLKIGTTTLLNQTPAPNQVISLGLLGKVILNEQVGGERHLSVNAIHVIVPALNVDVIISAASVGGPLLP